MQPPPADFSAAHTKVHSDADLVYWVKNGKQGTAMPSFSGTLSDQDILDVLTFIRSEQEAESTVSVVPDPASCTIAPMPVTELLEVVNTGAATAAEPVPASDPTVDSETQAAVLQVTEEFIACTNAGETMRRISLMSNSELAASFPSGVSDAFTAAAAKPPVALPEDQRIGVVGTPRMSQLSDGRVMVVMDVNDPGEQLGAGQGASVTLIMVKDQSGTWLIDDIR
jgi:hypothetical protein